MFLFCGLVLWAPTGAMQGGKGKVVAIFWVVNLELL